ncbi:glyoxysomal fatty acid beta-oxidation multifunctional protein MFP-a-like isoform X2 [Rutidosis leptorrhynchoides]|uniref:glyoxysomal fatty acid beta-oxidation multifunctional protein MFP-a-like isoform X2 n=1 Tax=Rutidosis leptorrhynchoides TaxID=125765 RepID=UPI003A98EC5E
MIPRCSVHTHAPEYTKFQGLLTSATCKILLNIFFAQAKMDQQGCYILGGCLIGSRITTTLILNGYEVLLKMVNQKFVEGRLGRVNAAYSEAHSTSKIDYTN